MTLDDFFTTAKHSVNIFTEWSERTKPAARADHLCYKCGSSEEFARLREMFTTESEFIYQSIVAGRPIAIIKMKISFETPIGSIDLLELSDQKPDGSQTSGFDHIEIYPVSGTMDELAQSLGGFEKVVRPHHTTYDVKITGEFKVRLEEEPLLEKIKREEM